MMSLTRRRRIPDATRAIMIASTGIYNGNSATIDTAINIAREKAITLIIVEYVEELISGISSVC
jgi:hypothetical protein